MLQMVREAVYSSEPQVQVTNARFMQCRLPAEQYEWLRYRAFVNRTSMNSIVLEAIAELQAESNNPNGSLTLMVTPGTSGGVKFNVRLSEETYEWLRTAAFNCRGSINQLLIGALATYRRRLSS